MDYILLVVTTTGGWIGVDVRLIMLNVALSEAAYKRKINIYGIVMVSGSYFNTMGPNGGGM